MGKKKTSKRKTRVKISVKSILLNGVRYIALAGLSAFFMSAIYVALPATELLWEDIRFDFIEREYWEKSYIIELRIKNQDEEKLERKIEETKTVISRRLYNLGASEVSVTGYHTDTNTPDDLNYYYRYLQVRVKGYDKSLTQEEVDNIVRSRNYLRLYLPKEDVDFDDEENNPYAAYFKDNYTPTGITRYDFRNVHIKKLTNQDGQELYFALFKPKIGSKFTDFAKEHAGEQVGLSLDQSISQIPIPYEFDPAYAQISNNPALFSIGISEDKRSADIADSLFNDGIIPLEYTVIQESPVEFTSTDFNHNYTAIAIFLMFGAYDVWMSVYRKVQRGEILRSMFKVGLLFAVWFGYFKFFFLPVDFTLLLVESLTVLVVLAGYFSIRNTNKSVADEFAELSVVLVLAVGALLGFGYIQEVSATLLGLAALWTIINNTVEYYLSNINDYING